MLILNKQTLSNTRLVLATLTIIAIVVQFMVAGQRPTFVAANFFSFFTIESNIIAAAMLAISGVVMLGKKQPAWLDGMRGLATIAMVTTGIVYSLLLSGNEEALQTTVPWVNFTLHYLLPVVMLSDWLIDPPKKQISWKIFVAWLAFPTLYLVYCLVRGPFVNWYPYPFLDPRDSGYGVVAVYSVCIAAAPCCCAGLVTRRPNGQSGFNT